MFIVTMALAVAMASVVIGSILSTALLIGPPAAALRVTRRVASSLALAGVLAVASTWLGVLFAYDSPEWSSSHRALPVSFFIVVLIVLSYLRTSSWSRWSSRHSVTD